MAAVCEYLSCPLACITRASALSRFDAGAGFVSHSKRGMACPGGLPLPQFCAVRRWPPTAAPGSIGLPSRGASCRPCHVSAEFQEATSARGSSRLGFMFGKGSPGSWDRGGVGRPVVKRYPGTPQGDPETWLMFYEGWGSPGSTPDDAEEGKFLPPSCVGLALSANGLIWTRGSTAVETDHRGRGGAGMVLQPSANWWSFDTRHVKASDVMMMSSPKVRASSGVYWMFYEGHSHEEVPLPDSVATSALQHLGRSLVSSQGLLRSRPGLALSNDARNWAAIEGEHHSGAVLDVGADGEWDSISICAPHVVFHTPGDLRMFYHALDPVSGCFFIGYARSRDGIKWFKMGKVLEKEANAAGLGCLNAQVTLNPGFKDIDESSYIMVYERKDQTGRGSICLAQSTDGLSNWAFVRELLSPSAEAGAWDSESVGAPCLVDMGDEGVRMYYQGRGGDGQEGIGVAEAQQSSLEFVRPAHISLTFAA